MEKAGFGSNLYCHNCGMDLGLSFITKRKNNKLLTFCCSECENEEAE